MELELVSRNGTDLYDEDKNVRKIMESILNSDLHHVLRMNGLEIVMKTSPSDLIQENHLRNIPIDERNAARDFVEKVLSIKQEEYSNAHLLNLDSLTLSKMVPEILNIWREGVTDTANVKVCIPLPQISTESRKRIFPAPSQEKEIIELMEFSERNSLISEPKTVNSETVNSETLTPEISVSGSLLDTRKQQLDNYIDLCKTSEGCLNATALYKGYTDWCDLHGYDKYTRPMVIGSFRKRIPNCEIKDVNGRSKGWSLSLPHV